MPRVLFIAAALLLLPPAAAAQTGAIQAGMSESEVRSTFGAPALTRSSGDWSYLFYRNGCTPRCGSDDVVFLRDGRVVAAVLRTPARRFSGPTASTALEGGEASASPPAAPARGASAPRPPGQAEVGGIRITLPGTEDVGVGSGIRGAGARDTDAQGRGGVVGPFPGGSPRSAAERAEEAQVRRQRGIDVPLPPPDTIDFRLPSGSPRVAPQRGRPNPNRPR